jgi:transcriptional regulator with XRE-family HTH domain
MYERYKKLLDEKGLKNSDVSRGANVSNMTLSDWKNGKTVPKTSTIKKIAEFLDVSVDYLTCGKEVDNKEMARIDIELAKQDIETKNYMLKFAKLELEKKKQIMSLIDMLSN